MFQGWRLKAQSDTPPPSLEDTYWDGAGDTLPMNAYAFSGAYLRFTDFPIQVYLGTRWGMWSQALEAALRELETVLPIQRATHRAQADILIQVLSDSAFARATPCQAIHQDACSQMFPSGEPSSGDFAVSSRVWIRAKTAHPPQGILLHELLHALGLLIHSPSWQDALYNGADSVPITLSARDRATLRYLYQQPALGD